MAKRKKYQYIVVSAPRKKGHRHEVRCRNGLTSSRRCHLSGFGRDHSGRQFMTEDEAIRECEGSRKNFPDWSFKVFRVERVL